MIAVPRSGEDDGNLTKQMMLHMPAAVVLQSPGGHAAAERRRPRGANHPNWLTKFAWLGPV
jgi:hypothetical protein